MSVRYLGFALLISFPGVLHAQSVALPCAAPGLKKGYFFPVDQTYAHETTLTYACDEGYKPAVDSWWATTTCENGTWSHQPQCIDKNACSPLTIPNANYIRKPNVWYKERSTIRIKCHTGYEAKDYKVTAHCSNGTWSSVPVCKKSVHACSEPPQVPDAVIVNQEYQELFAVDSRAQYECRDGYTLEEKDKEISFCINGTWTEGPTCLSASNETKTEPTLLENAKGSSSGSAANEAKTEPPITAISSCGHFPLVENAVVVRTAKMYLKYQCSDYYKRVGPETVVCYGNGLWSKIPFCEANFCSVDTDDYSELKSVGVRYLKDGETVELGCVKKPYWLMEHFSMVRCNDGIISLSQCCNKIEKRLKFC